MNFSRKRLGEIAPLVFFALVAIAVVVGFIEGLALAVLLLAALAFGLAIWLLSSSVRGLSGDTPLSLEEALGFGAPSAEEEQKRAVLRALKDLEYERSVGKISEEDYREFSARYREDARRLISLVDDSMLAGRDLAEKLLAARVAEAGLDGTATAPKPETETETETKSQSPESESDSESPDSEPETSEPKASSTSPAETGRSCPSCETKNDADASFCKRCAAPLTESPGTLASAEAASEEKLS